MQADLSIFPLIDASLNGLAAVLIGSGVYFIKTQRPQIHKKFMIAAVICSSLFLACYLTYHGILGRHSGSVSSSRSAARSNGLSTRPSRPCTRPTRC